MISRFLAFLAGAIVTLSVIDPALLGTRVDSMRESMVAGLKNAGAGALATMPQTRPGTTGPGQLAEADPRPRNVAPASEPAADQVVEETVVSDVGNLIEKAIDEAIDEAAAYTAKAAREASPAPRQSESATNPDPSPPIPAQAGITEQWQAVWSPFRSELSARGFSSRLTNQTGIPLEVIRESQGVYQVAFAYTDATMRDDLLVRLRSAAGLGEASL
jgi:hypothetical protein